MSDYMLRALLLIAAVLAPYSGAQAQILAVATLEGTYTQPVSSSNWQAIVLSAGNTDLTIMELALL